MVKSLPTTTEGCGFESPVVQPAMSGVCANTIGLCSGEGSRTGRVILVIACIPMGWGGTCQQGVLGGRSRTKALRPPGGGSSLAGESVGYNSSDNTEMCVGRNQLV